MKTFKFRIFGRVQGVGFRYSAQREAEKHQLNGWVKNEPDGSVTVEASGEEESGLNAFSEWCHRGPASAKVEKVNVEELEYPARKVEGFQVAY